MASSQVRIFSLAYPAHLPVQTERYCTPSNRTITFGDGGQANWIEHEQSAKHLHNVQATEGTQSLKSFFPVNAKIPCAAASASGTGSSSIGGPIVPASSTTASATISMNPTNPPLPVSDIIDVDSLDSIPVPPHTPESETRQLLARVVLVISGLPSTSLSSP
jgi:hypothetical protein